MFFDFQRDLRIIQTARAAHPVEEELERVIADVDAVIARFTKIAKQDGFEDMLGAAHRSRPRTNAWLLASLRCA